MNTLTISQFRKGVKTRWPHVKISVRTVSFADLARCSAKCLAVTGEKRGDLAPILAPINELAKQAGIIPDTSLRFYPPENFDKKMK